MKELTQSKTASKLSQLIAIKRNSPVEVSLFEIDNVLKLFNLIDYQGNPTDKAERNGLPDHNQLLVNAIHKTAKKRQSMAKSLDRALLLNAVNLFKPYTEKWEAINKDQQRNAQKAKNYRRDYFRQLDRLITLIND